MTEIERLLTNTLAVLEKELRQTQETQRGILSDQQHILAAHTDTLRQLQQQVSRLDAQQQESVQHLQHLSAIHEDLAPLLERLNGILNRKSHGQ